MHNLFIFTEETVFLKNLKVSSTSHFPTLSMVDNSEKPGHERVANPLTGAPSASFDLQQLTQ
jgi:hypothetical protein